MAHRSINKALSQYLKNLDIGDNNRSSLVSARTSIRAHLRLHFPIGKGKIKFRTQGSFQYQTINHPCYPPKQQMDLDDGIYVPKSCVGETSSKKMLNCVAESLQSHDRIKNQSWELKVKPSCVRIFIAQDKHVDIPLYRAPDKDMEEIKGSAVRSSDSTIYEFQVSGVRRLYAKIGKNCVELACEDGWTNSDPSQIFSWFAKNHDKYGNQYIRICRILKAWRDWQWPNDDSDLSSILLMRMVDIIFGEDMDMDQSAGYSDDYLLYTVSRKLAHIISNPIADPDPTRDNILNDKLIKDTSQLQECMDRFDQLKNTLYSVLHGKNLSDSEVVKKLCAEFGKFFPNDQDLCKILPVVAPLVTTPAAASPRSGPYGG